MLAILESFAGVVTLLHRTMDQNQSFAVMSAWNWPHALWLPPIGILASLGQLAMTKAHAMSKNHVGTLMPANLQYSGIEFSAFYSLVLFGDNIPLMCWAGMELITVSAAPDAPVKAH